MCLDLSSGRNLGVSLDNALAYMKDTYILEVKNVCRKVAVSSCSNGRLCFYFMDFFDLIICKTIYYNNKMKIDITIAK